MNKIKELSKKLFTKQQKEHSERYKKVIQFLNKFSLIFHFILSCIIVFIVEWISHRSFQASLEFFDQHTKAYLFNAFIVFASLMLVYLFRRRAFVRIIISGFWLLLGIINGCILSNRVTPFGFTDLKCIPDLLSMSNTSYFTAQEATCVVFGLIAFILFCIIFFIKGPRYEGKINRVIVPVSIISVIFVISPLLTNFLQEKNIMASYFSNIAQGYKNFGFIYGFASSVLDRGMDKPEDYSEETIEEIMDEIDENKQETTVTAETAPNVIVVLLESFVDPEEIQFLEYEGDPVPTFHYLEQNYSTGYLTVPVIGAGTANTEFEILTGMQLQHFGTGEYPYKTILKKTDCESIASSLTPLGYSTHAVHNNGGNFYSRVNAFSMMGFDSFTSKEMMDITEYTPTGSWPTDTILVDETIKTLTTTPNQPDFTYTITVSSHGDYPEEAVLTNPTFPVTGADTEEENNQWTYYINQLNAVDQFMYELIYEVSLLEEDTIIIFFGDHLPTMGLEEGDMLTGDIYKTSYVTWNNMNLPKEDADLYAYQLLAHFTNQLGIHEGTIFNYHQTCLENDDYLTDLENLQYDLLYGKRYAYRGEDIQISTDIVMGVNDIIIDNVFTVQDDERVYISGQNFTKWSYVYVNNKKTSTTYINGGLICIDIDDIDDGDSIVVTQLGSSNSKFRSSKEYVYDADNIIETEIPVIEETEE